MSQDAIGMAARERNVIDDLQRSIMKWAEEKGWNQGLDERSFGDWCTLINSEIIEAYEDYRDHRALNEIYYELDGDTSGKKYTREEAGQIANQFWRDQSPRPSEAPIFKPCGIPIEMADAVIRILHIAEFANFNLYNCIEEKMRYNQIRAHRHGGKKV
jgi:hypothetical protein